MAEKFTNWSHRDCEDHCFWLLPRGPCQETKRMALTMDKVISIFELSAKYKGDTITFMGQDHRTQSIHLEDPPDAILESLKEIKEAFLP